MNGWKITRSVLSLDCPVFYRFRFILLVINWLGFIKNQFVRLTLLNITYMQLRKFILWSYRKLILLWNIIIMYNAIENKIILIKLRHILNYRDGIFTFIHRLLLIIDYLIINFIFVLRKYRHINIIKRLYGRLS